MLDRLIHALVPPVCLACRAPGADLCRDCRRALPWLRGPLCPRCALPPPCGAPCPAAGAAFASSWAPVAYTGVARDLVLALKGRAAFSAAHVMAAQMVAGAPPGLLDARPVLVPVPGHPRRTRARGFDQAACLAAAIARRGSLPQAGCLRRGRAGGRQVGAGRAGRLAAGGVDVSVRGRAPRRVLLVDDVHTTGATLRACAVALRSAGSEWVGAVTYARTLRDGLARGADNEATGG